MMGSMLRRGSLGDGSTLSLDFTTMSTAADLTAVGITFTRASGSGISGTGPSYVGSNGLVQYAGTNIPRFDYDSISIGTPRGLLVEASATNLLTYSQAFTPDWTDTSITRDVTLQTSPDGTANALRVTASAGNATIIRSAAIGTSASRTFSVWLRRVSGSGNIQYTQDNGTTYTTQAITSSWVRYQFTHTANHQVGIRIVTSGDSIELWGAQLEAGSGASSYIPTGASTATRAQDQAQITDLSAVGFNTTAATMLINGTYNKDANAFPRSVRFMGSSVQSMAMITAGKTLYGNAPNTSGGTYFDVNRTLAAFGAFKYGFTLTTAANPATATAHISVNGNSSSITPLGQGAIVNPTSLQFLYGAGSVFDYPSMNIAVLKYWPYAMTTAELNTRTTL